MRPSGLTQGADLQVRRHPELTSHLREDMSSGRTCRYQPKQMKPAGLRVLRIDRLGQPVFRRIGQLEEYVRFVTDHPAVVIRADDAHITCNEFHLDALIHADPLAAGGENLDVPPLTTLSTNDWFHMR